MSQGQQPIASNPPRWKPNSDPNSIVVPGLDTDASTIDQIEQIEQLITIKLQNIDENFSKIHNLLTNKLLPAVKRYAVGTEPVREAAKFWTSFYEQAAQIRIPTFDDYSTVNELPSEREEVEPSIREEELNSNNPNDGAAHQTQGIYETSVVNSETSFLPGQGAFSSTPAMVRMATRDSSFATEASDEPSWTRSLESPMVRLNREIDNLSREVDDSVTGPSLSLARTPAREGDASAGLTGFDKGKDRDTHRPLLKNVLRHNLYAIEDSSSFENRVARVSPLKLKPKTPTVSKELNPYLGINKTPADWNGVVDLRDPSVLTPQRHTGGKYSTSTTPYADDEEDSFDALPPGMSPPVLMSPARPPRSSAELGLLRLGQTPARDASTRIQRDLLRDTQMKSRGGDIRQSYNFRSNKPSYESSMSTVLTPPSLSKYNRNNEYSSNSISKDSSLESMMQRLNNDLRFPEVNRALETELTSDPGSNKNEQVSDMIPSPAQQQNYFTHPPVPETPMYGQQLHHQQDIDSDSDSMDEINNTAHPSAAFLMVSQGGAAYDEDSFGSSDHSSDSLADENVTAGDIVPVHPFATNAVVDDGFDDDDSFDDGLNNRSGNYSTEETVFGGPPAQRLGDARRSEDGNLRMLGEDLLQDTIGIGTHMAATGRVEESPTPASWAH